jgi:hypothetical protein
MGNPSGPQCPPPDIQQLHAEFLAILPRIETHAKICFRYLKCPGKKADAIAETLAVAWKWYLGIIARGKDVNEFVSTLASLAARHVRSGRKLCGQEASTDVLSALAQRRRGFEVESLPCSTSRGHEALYGDPPAQREFDALEAPLRDNAVPSCAEFPGSSHDSRCQVGSDGCWRGW